MHFNIVNRSGGYYNNAYFGTIHPDGGGNITMVFDYSGYLTYAGTNYLSQRVTLAPQATFHDGGSVLRSGLAAYPDSRWGDFDPAPWHAVCQFSLLHGPIRIPLTLCNLRACASSDVVELDVSCRGSMLPVK